MNTKPKSSHFHALDHSNVLDGESGKRSILVGGLTRDLYKDLDKILNAFQKLEITGGGKIQNFEIFDHEKMRITYLNRQDAERVLSKGTTFKFDNTMLYVSKFPNSTVKYGNDLSESAQAPKTQNTLDLKNKNSSEMGPTDLMVLDGRRIILTNVLSFIDQDYFELYIEYLSNEVEIVRFDLCKELNDGIVITFEKNIDYESIKKRHDLKPNLMNIKTDLFPVYMPDTVVIETKEKIENFQFNKEILELYFSNKKRSGGENVREISFNSKYHKIAYVSFKDFESAKRVSQKRIHIINKVNFECKLYYRHIGPDPFSEVKNNLFKNAKTSISFKNEYRRDFSASLSYFNPLEELHQKTFYKRPSKSHLYTDLSDTNVKNLEKKIDPNLLTNQQTGFLLELQSIYNELNNSNVTLFTSDPNCVDPDSKNTDEYLTFSMNKSENELKYLSEFILDEASEFKKKLDTSSILSKDTELEVNDIQDCHFTGCSFEEEEEDSLKLHEKKIIDNDSKPIVNLPRLDDFYKINSLKPNYINLSELNPHSLMTQNEAKVPNQNSVLSTDLNENFKSNYSISKNDAIAKNPHKALRTLNFSTRRQPRVIYKSRDRPPPPKLLRLNNSKRLDPDSTSVETQTPSDSIPSFNSNLAPSAILNSTNQFTPNPIVNQNLTFKPISTRISSQNGNEKISDSGTNNRSNDSNNDNNYQQNLTTISEKIQQISRVINHNRMYNAKIDQNSVNLNFTQESPLKIEPSSIFLESDYSRLIPDSVSPITNTKQLSGKTPFKLEASDRALGKILDENNNITAVLINSTQNSLSADVYSIKSEIGNISVKTGQKSSLLAATPKVMAKNFENEPTKKSFCGTWKKSKSVKKNYKLNNHIIQQYGRMTEADSINKLDANQIEFLKNTNYISYLKLIYPKLSINLNENLRNLYFFGAKEQVNNAKIKIISDINSFKTTEFPLEDRELAEFLQKPEVKFKINDFINYFISHYESGKKGKEIHEKNSEFSKADVFKVFFCNYEVKIAISNKENGNSLGTKFCLRVFTNIANFQNVLLKHINEAIVVNYKIEIPSQNSILESISKQDKNWTDIYLKYSKCLDFCVESYKEKSDMLKEIKPNATIKQKKWFIKLTGFKIEIEKFKKEFKKKFIDY